MVVFACISKFMVDKQQIYEHETMQGWYKPQL